MNRQLTTVLVALLVASVGCGKPPAATQKKAKADNTSKGQAPASGGARPAAKEQPAGWQTVKGSRKGRDYTLQIPGDWNWSENMADKTSFIRTSTFTNDIDEADFKKDSPHEFAKWKLEFFQMHYDPSLDKGKVLDLRIVKVGDAEAAWAAYAFGTQDGTPSVRMETHCCFITQGYEVDLKGDLADARPERKEADIVAAAAEFLKISQSFRLTPGK